MADRLLRDTDGLFMKDTNGLFIKDRPFSETIISKGLYASFDIKDSSKFNLIDGLVYEWYSNENPAIKFSQNTVSYRPVFNVNYVDMNLNTMARLVLNSPIYAKSIFIVIKGFGGSAGYGFGNNYFTDSCIGNDANVFANATQMIFINNSIKQTYWANNVKYIQTVSSVANFAVLGWSSGASTYRLWDKLGNLYANNNTAKMQIKHLSIYSESLNEQEIIYNGNALMTKYQIF